MVCPANQHIAHNYTMTKILSTYQYPILGFFTVFFESSLAPNKRAGLNCFTSTNSRFILYVKTTTNTYLSKIRAVTESLLYAFT